MRYPAYVTIEGRTRVVIFPDCPGCQTQADSDAEVVATGQEALEGWLEATLAAGDVVPRPRPRARAPRAGFVVWVPVAAQLGVKLHLRWARQDKGLSQAELARRAGVSQQQIAKLEDPDSNPTIETLEKVAQALGRRLEVSLAAAWRT